jgi:uncharacterized protein YidB (DUF937 family)
MRPSMTALLTVLAVAGYQNRDRLGQLLGAPAQGGSAPRGKGDEAGRQGGEGLGIGGAMAGAGLGGVLAQGLRDVVESFRSAGQGEIAESWVGHGPNRPVAPAALAGAIGADTLDALTRQTGLSRQEILARLSRDLPRTVDSATPEGRLPQA